MRFAHGTGAETARTNLHPLNGAAFLVNGPDLLQIRPPDPFGLVVGMAYIITEDGLFPAYLARSGHILHSSNCSGVVATIIDRNMQVIFDIAPLHSFIRSSWTLADPWIR